MDDQQYLKILQRFEQLEAEIDSLRQVCENLVKGLSGILEPFAKLTGSHIGETLAEKYKDLYKDLRKEKLAELAKTLMKGDDESARYKDAVVKLEKELEKALKIIEGFR